MKNEIIHNHETKVFSYNSDGRDNYLTYELKGISLDLIHTFVDPDCRRQGIAKDLVTEAFMFAEKNGFKVIPTCSYVSAFVKRHPRWGSFLA